jgi:hypothetical protein
MSYHEHLGSLQNIYLKFWATYDMHTINISDLQSGHLLHSAKSRCRWCGKEIVDPTELPDELIAHGIQVMLNIG